MTKQHRYHVRVTWTGNTGSGTANYHGYSRDHEILAGGKPVILGSSDPVFRGDPTKWNPEELLVASVSTCHKLWYLSLCSRAGIVVISYDDHAEGLMLEEPAGSGYFTAIVLRPVIELAKNSNVEAAEELHKKAHEMCFIARSLNCSVEIEPTITRI
ncbi:OsmC family protein [Methylocystis sp. IM3]|uniref:OsmC family protein n=1 Tax=unclassified Methylocystis TaxID=2625913 RepID=UPI0030FC4B35